MIRTTLIGSGTLRAFENLFGKLSKRIALNIRVQFLSIQIAEILGIIGRIIAPYPSVILIAHIDQLDLQ